MDDVLLSYYHEDEPARIAPPRATQDARRDRPEDIRAAIGRQRSNTATRQREQHYAGLSHAPDGLAPSPNIQVPRPSPPRPKQAPNLRDAPQRLQAAEVAMPPRAAFAGPASAVSSPSASLMGTPRSEKSQLRFGAYDSSEGLAGPENDRMAPALGEKDSDFWKRFSRVVHAAEVQPARRKGKSGWLGKETRGSRTFQISVWFAAILILGIIAGALAWHFTHNINSSSNPTQHDFGITANVPASTAASVRVILPVGGGSGNGQPTPTATHSHRMRLERRRSPHTF